MRVLHVIATGARRGGEVFAADLVRALDAEGLDQAVAILHGPPPDRLELAAPAVVLDEGSRADGTALDPSILWSLRRHLHAFRPDLVQAHGGEALKYLALTSFRRPIVYRRIGSVVDPLRKGVRRAAFVAQMARAARVVAVAEAVRRETIDVFGIAPDKVLTIPNAVDAARFRASVDRASFLRSLGLAAGARVVTFVGAFTWEKDPLTSVEVMTRVLGAFPDVVFLIAGDGPLRSDVEAAAAAGPHRNRVLLLGSRSDVPDLLGASDVLVSTSATEGMPANLIEAGLMGVPVVAYALSGVPEVVLDGETGVVAAPGDRAALEAGLVRLLEDEDARRAMGDAARARCTERFEIRAVAPLYLDLYRQLLARGNGS